MEQKTKLCPHCKKEIDATASRCPHCQGKMYVWTKGRKVLLGFAIFTALILLITNGSDKNTAPSQVTPSKETSSIVYAEHVIKDSLKSPSTAKFVDVRAYELSNLKDVWAVNGYVDSQNSFGAMIRSQWEVQLDYRDGKGGTVKSILLDGKKIQ